MPPVYVRQASFIAKYVSPATGSIAWFIIPDTLSRAFANPVVCVKKVLRYAIVIAQGISLNAGFIARFTLFDAGAVAISEVVVVMLTVRIICTAKAHVVSALCSFSRAGSIALFILQDALSSDFTSPQICVKIVLNEAFSVAQRISLYAVSIVHQCCTAGLRLGCASVITFIMIFLTSAVNFVSIIIVDAIKVSLRTIAITGFLS